MDEDGSGDETTITAQECLRLAEDAEEEADLVLGGDDGDKCTYSLGYVPRQAVFSCITCTPTIQAGFCVACSLQCHEGHQVEELYTRRNFRCDCGNSKFGGVGCKLYSGKDATNEKNVYNQNFKGMYCSCSRPYPDPERQLAGLGEEMIQCVVCEDWYHEEHLGLGDHLSVPVDEEGNHLFEELVCQSCSKDCTFIAHYPGLPVQPSEVIDEVTNVKDDNVHVVVEDEPDLQASLASLSSERNGETVAKIVDGSRIGASGSGRDNQEDSFVVSPNQHSQEGSKACVYGEAVPQSKSVSVGTAAGSRREGGETDAKCDGRTCKVSNAKLSGGRGAALQGPVFFPKGWRSQVCTCTQCCRECEEKNVSFLLDENDTIYAYEQRAKLKREGQPSSTDRAMAAFMSDSAIPHVQKMELIHGFNDMASKFKDFVQPFRQNGEVVTSEAINTFFASLNEKRRRIK